MPCNSGYMNPNRKEVNSRQVAEHLAYVYSRLGVKAPQQVADAAVSCYGNVKALNEMVVTLCNLVSNMTPEEKDEIVYDGRNAGARKLATWWDEHIAADLRRAEQELAVAIQNQSKEAALSKLTPYEKELLGLK